MLTMLLDRITGLLRPTKPATHAPSERDRAPLISPITIGLLEAIGIRHALAVQWLPHISQSAHRYQIDANPRRLAAWLATIAHESARLTSVVENLNYSAEGLAADVALALRRHDRAADRNGAAHRPQARADRKPHLRRPDGQRHRRIG